MQTRMRVVWQKRRQQPFLFRPIHWRITMGSTAELNVGELSSHPAASMGELSSFSEFSLVNYQT